MGTGTLILSNSDTYIGSTTVDSGKLVVNGQVLNSAITIGAGGTLGGDGSVAAADVQSGGFLSRQFPRHLRRKSFIPGDGYHVHGTTGR